jgi:hypothetical protein
MVAKMNPAYIKPDPEMYYTSSDDDTDNESSYYSDNESSNESDSEESSTFSSSEEDAFSSDSDSDSGSDSDSDDGSSDESISQDFAATAIKDELEDETMLDGTPKVRPREELQDDSDSDSEDEYLLAHLPFKKTKSAEEFVDKDPVVDDVSSQHPLSHSAEFPRSLFACDFMDKEPLDDDDKTQPPPDLSVDFLSCPTPLSAGFLTRPAALSAELLAPATPEAVAVDVTAQPAADLSADLPDPASPDAMVDDVTEQPSADLSADLPAPPVLLPSNLVDKNEMADDVIPLYLGGIPAGCNDITAEEAVINRFLSSFPTRESWECFARFVAEIKWPEEHKSLLASLKDKLISLFKH